MAMTEQEVVKRVQFWRRQENGQVKVVQAERRQLNRMVASRDPWTDDSSTHAEIDAQRDVVKAEEKELAVIRERVKAWENRLDRMRNPLTERQKLAAAIEAHPNSRFAYWSPTGGTARASFQAQAAGKKAYCAWTGTYTDMSIYMLRFILACCQAGVVLINCTVNGKHVDLQGHPNGWCVDLDNTSAVSLSKMNAIASTHRAQKNSETSHRHYDCAPRWSL